MKVQALKSSKIFDHFYKILFLLVEIHHFYIAALFFRYLIFKNFKNSHVESSNFELYASCFKDKSSFVKKK